jgi:archaellum component FlaC
MAKVATRSVELEPIDRLEEKLRLLVAMVDRMKADEVQMRDENQRLARELEAMRERSEAAANELSELQGQRDTIRTRVTDMLEQLEALNL